MESRDGILIAFERDDRIIGINRLDRNALFVELLAYVIHVFIGRSRRHRYDGDRIAEFAAFFAQERFHREQLFINVLQQTALVGKRDRVVRLTHGLNVLFAVFAEERKLIGCSRQFGSERFHRFQLSDHILERARRVVHRQIGHHGVLEIKLPDKVVVTSSVRGAVNGEPIEIRRYGKQHVLHEVGIENALIVHRNAVDGIKMPQPDVLRHLRIDERFENGRFHAFKHVFGNHARLCVGRHKERRRADLFERVREGHFGKIISRFRAVYVIERRFVDPDGVVLHAVFGRRFVRGILFENILSARGTGVKHAVLGKVYGIARRDRDAFERGDRGERARAERRHHHAFAVVGIAEIVFADPLLFKRKRVERCGDFHRFYHRVVERIRINALRRGNGKRCDRRVCEGKIADDLRVRQDRLR